MSGFIDELNDIFTRFQNSSETFDHFGTVASHNSDVGDNGDSFNALTDLNHRVIGELQKQVSFYGWEECKSFVHAYHNAFSNFVGRVTSNTREADQGPFLSAAEIRQLRTLDDFVRKLNGVFSYGSMSILINTINEQADHLGKRAKKMKKDDALKRQLVEGVRGLSSAASLEDFQGQCGALLASIAKKMPQSDKIDTIQTQLIRIIEDVDAAFYFRAQFKPRCLPSAGAGESKEDEREALLFAGSGSPSPDTRSLLGDGESKPR